MEKVIYRSDLERNLIKPSNLINQYNKLVEEDILNFFNLEENIELPELKNACHKFTKSNMHYLYSDKLKGIFLSPRPDEKKLKKYYINSKSRTYWLETILTHTEETRNKKIVIPQINWINSIINQYIKTNKDVIKSVEINATNWSYFEKSNLINNLEYSFYDAFLNMNLIPKNLSDLKIHEEIMSKKFDIIFLFEALDRAFDPFKLLRDSFQALEKNGICFITCLLSSGFEAKSLGKESDIFSPPEKMNIFSFEGLLSLFNNISGVEIIEFSTPSLFDLENVANKSTSTEKNEFIKYIMNERNDINLKNSFRDFLQLNQLGSSARIAIKKV